MKQIIMALSVGLFVVALLLMITTYLVYRAKKGVAEKVEQNVQRKLREITKSDGNLYERIQEHIRTQTEHAKYEKLLM
jgi:hypothetical protein